MLIYIGLFALLIFYAEFVIYVLSNMKLHLVAVNQLLKCILIYIYFQKVILNGIVLCKNNYWKRQLLRFTFYLILNLNKLDSVLCVSS